MSDYDEIEVRSRYDGAWCGGFEVARLRPGARGGWSVWVRRHSDGTVLPEPFAADEVRRALSARAVVQDFERRFLTDPETPLGRPAGQG